MWSIFIANHFTERPVASSLPYVLVQVLGSVISPVAGCVGVAMWAIVIHFLSGGQIDPRAFVTYANPAVVYTCVNDITDPDRVTTDTTIDYNYWVISDHYIIRLTSGQPSVPTDKISSYIDHSPTTWLIFGSIVLALLLAMNYFVNAVLVDSTIVGVPPKKGECEGLNCFANWNTQLVDCTDDTTYAGKSYLHCYSFSAHEREFWESISISFGLHAAFMATFKVLFVIASVTLNVFRTKVWGVLFILIGAAGVIITIVAYFLDLGKVHLDEAKTLRIIIVFLTAVISGVLLLFGNVKELIKDPLKTRALLVTDS